MASYIGIPVPQRFLSDLYQYQKELYLETYENFPHVTLDYIGAGKIIFAPKILIQVYEKCFHILNEKIIFDRVITFENKINSNEVVVAIGADMASESILKYCYDAMNVVDWHSKASSENWIPHITLGKISKTHTTYNSNIVSSPPKIILSLRDLQIL